MMVFAVGCASPILNVVDGEVNTAPELLDVSIACDSATEEWVFAAEVAEPDCDTDVIEIQAFVYDELSEEQTASAALGEVEPGLWSARAPGPECAYGRYSADFIVQDASGSSDVMSAFAASAAMGG
jgi:hypothetical protein